MCKQNTGFVSKTPGELLLRTKGYKKVWLLGKYKEMRGKSRLLHSTVQKQKPSSPFEANETKSNHLLRVVQHCSTVGSESAETKYKQRRLWTADPKKKLHFQKHSWSQFPPVYRALLKEALMQHRDKQPFPNIVGTCCWHQIQSDPFWSGFLFLFFLTNTTNNKISFFLL